MTTTNTDKGISSVHSGHAASSLPLPVGEALSEGVGIKINPEYEALLMPLSGAEFEILEEGILEYGLQYPQESPFS